jgi:putative transposase
MTPSTEEGLSVLMRDLGQRYVQYVNRTYGRSGTLWEGRYRSCIAESARYVLACYRYIELNPVRAGLADRPLDASWTSHRGNAGTVDDALLAGHPEYLALGEDPASRQRAYRDLFRDTLEPTLVERIREATHRGYPLGSERFTSDMALTRGWKIAPGRPGRPGRPTAQRLGDDESSPEIGL